MSTLLYRLGRGAALHPWRAIGAWLAFSALVFAVAAWVGGDTRENWQLPGSESQRGLDLIREHVPAAGSAMSRVVVHSDHPIAADALDTLDANLARMPHVAAVKAPAVSADGDTALVIVTYDVQVTDPDLMENLAPLETAIAPTKDAGYQVELNGELPETAAAPMRGTGELVGVIAALVILVVAFGSVIAAGLPVLTAIAGLAVGSAGLAILAGVMDVSNTAPTVATMVGLGVGIDYALLMVSRHVEFLRAGHDPVEAAGRACATAGRSVVFAAMTVLVSLLGLRLADLQTYAAFGFATAIAVICVLAAALVLVPALCRLGGRRLMPRTARRGSSAVAATTPLTARWAARVGRTPLPWALAAVVVMLALAAPALDIRTWPGDPSAASSELTTRKAFDLIAEEFGPGANASYVVVAERDRVDAAAVGAARDALAARSDLAAVSPVVDSPDGAISIIELQPTFGPIDARTPDLVSDIRADLPDGVVLTGQTPLLSDISELLAERLWVVIAFVVGVSMLLLMMVFRSVLVPLKAALMNLLSIGAAYGVMVAVFQWGWGAQLLGLDHATPVSSWVPILIFAILFGLSMDYEVFLLSRIREDWLATGDAQASVVRGLRDTGRVISSAAAIMVAVFIGFASEVDVVVQMLGVGLAAAVLLDATVIRMVLVPATMTMLGRWNWWMPSWLDRVLPAIEAEASPSPAGPAATTAPQDSTPTAEPTPEREPALVQH